MEIPPANCALLGSSVFVEQGGTINSGLPKPIVPAREAIGEEEASMFPSGCSLAATDETSKVEFNCLQHIAPSSTSYAKNADQMVM